MTLNLSDIKQYSIDLIDEAYDQGRQFGERSYFVDVVCLLHNSGHGEIAQMLQKQRRQKIIREALVLPEEAVR